MTLVDTNVLLDIATDDPRWVGWSLRQLDAAAIRGRVLIWVQPKKRPNMGRVS
jgi:hypothetical protein